DISTLDRGDADADGWLAVESEDAARRVRITSLQCGNVAQGELPAGTVRPNHDGGHIIRHAEPAFPHERRALDATPHAAAVRRHVHGLQQAVDLVFVDFKTGEPLTGDFEKHLFRLLSE